MDYALAGGVLMDLALDNRIGHGPGAIDPH